MKGLISLLERKLTHVFHPPYTLNLDITDRCNLSCGMCALKFVEPKLPDMTLTQFDSIIRQFNSKKTRTINFAGMGEPTLNEDFEEICSLAKKNRFQICLYTNSTGPVPNTVDNVVFNAIDCENFLSNIKDFHGKKTINFVASKDNYSQIDRMKKLAKKLNAEIQITEIRKMYPAFSLSKNYDEHIENIKISIEEATERSILRHKTCMAPWGSTNISHDGWVTPCCIYQHPYHINFGNCLEIPFKKIWNNSQYREFRRLLKSPNPPAVCLKCGL